MRTLAITALLMLSGCATTAHDWAVAANTVKRINYLASDSGSQYIREQIEYHATRR